MVTGSSSFEKILVRVEDIATETAERRQNPSPSRSTERSRPLRLTTIIPTKPNRQPIIFFASIFSILKRSVEKSIAKNADEPESIVALTPLVFASPT